MPGIEFLSSFVDTDVTVILFTWFVLGAICFGMSVLPRWQEQEAVRTAKPTPVKVLPKAA